ncbi:MAG: insulinase family protein [Alphaproteobacteria bacterium]|nr:insulinase family protein [Alphaproteobacteria bacterium]MCB9691307.1 insulinase family protein [Alphaproteobacteria bacterium]
MTLLLASVALAADPLAVEATTHVLPNGLRVVLSEDHATDTIALHIHYGVGGRDERPGEYGCAHLFEHLMFEGSANVPNNAFDEWLTSAGGDNNAFTSEDETAYHMTFPSGALDLALMLESDRMGFLDAGLDQANLENQQKVVLQERAEGFGEPHGRDWDALQIVGWPSGHGYQHSVIGTIADVEGFQLEGVVDFWRRHYKPRNAVLTLVGNFETAEALERVQHWFGDVPDTGPPEPRAPAALPEPPVAHHRVQDDVEDRTLIVMYPGVHDGHEDVPALELLGPFLSGGRGTRLDDALYYDRSVLTTVGAWSSVSEIGGHFLLYLQTDDLTLPKVLKKVDKELKKVTKAPPTEAELERAKRGYRADLLDSIEGLESRAEVLTDCLRLRGEASCLPAEMAQVEAVTVADLERVMAQYLNPTKRATLSIVPREDDGAIEGATDVEIP